MAERTSGFLDLLLLDLITTKSRGWRMLGGNSGEMESLVRLFCDVFACSP